MTHQRNIKKNLLTQAVILSMSTAVHSVQAEDFQLEEIVVTAQKRAESLQDVPVSVSAISSGDLEGLKIRASTEIAAQIPNMQISTPYGDGFPVISMRGISMSDFSLNQSSPVALYVDEVYKGNPALQGVQLFDLDRVEVLRGPQGTLYGKNTTGGAVNYITKTASLETEGYISAGVGDYQRKEIQGAYQTAVIDDLLAVRIAGTWVEANGWKENKVQGKDDANAIDEWGARISLAYTPSDDLEVLLRLSSSESNPTNFGVTAEEGDNGVGNGLYEQIVAAGSFAGGTNGGNAESYFRRGLNDFEIESNSDRKRKIETDAAALTINWDLTPELTLTSISSWDDGSFFSYEDADGSPLQVVETQASSEAEQFAQDLRITSNYSDDFNFIAGLYYSEETIESSTRIGFYNDLDVNQDGSLDSLDCLDPLYYAAGLGGIATTAAADNLEAVLNAGGSSLADLATMGCQGGNNYKQDRNSIAGYFDGNLILSDSTTFRFGVRYTEDETKLKGLESRMRDSSGNDLTAALGGVPLIPSTSDDFVDREWTGKVSIDYVTESETLLYASFSKGYRSGAFNAQAFLDPVEVNSVDPEYVDAYELGFKSSLWDGRLRLNGAAFHYAYEGQQFLDVNTATIVQTLVNVERSDISGFELELTARPIEPLIVRAGLGWLDTEVKKGTLSGVDLKGKELVAAPELNFNLSMDYDIDLNDMGVLTLHMDTSFVDDQYFDVFNSKSIQGDDHWVSNLRVSFESFDNMYSLALWAKNLEDKVYVTQAYDIQPSFGLNNLQIGAPRTVGLEATLRF